jgi:glutathionylspermidine synthase
MQATQPRLPADYDVFARRVVASGVLTDPWIDGEPRFRAAPLVVPADRAAALASAGALIAAAYHELCLLVEDEPRFLDDFFQLTPHQRLLWEASKPVWHGLARADLFFTADGLACAELNCDTPTGEAEAVVLGALAHADHPHLGNPNQDLERRFCALVELVSKRELARPPPGPLRVGLVYPTEFTEDLSLVRLYKKWFEARGWSVVLGSPYNLTSTSDGVALFGRPIDVMLRHYKTDWWTERASAWDDDELPDQAPLEGPLRVMLGGMASGTLAVVNPLGAVLAQNKRAMAFLWEHLHRFSLASQRTIEQLVPFTSRLETLHREQLVAEQREWVLKSDYGAEGEEVVVGRAVDRGTWLASLEHARPGRWVAQRHFEAETNAAGEVANYGVFLIAGEPAGLYVREQVGPTDASAVSVPVLLGE